jgi:hypothetical protein
MVTTQQQVRDAFWGQHPEYQRRGRQRQNNYPADVRAAWCEFVDALARDGQITEALADRVTL